MKKACYYIINLRFSLLIFKTKYKMCLFVHTGFPAAYAAYAAGRSYSGYPSFGLPYPAGNTLASLHHQLSGNHYHHLATLLPYHPLELSGVYNVHAMHL
jgi:hypothetical protein